MFCRASLPTIAQCLRRYQEGPNVNLLHTCSQGFILLKLQGVCTRGSTARTLASNPLNLCTASDAHSSRARMHPVTTVLFLSLRECGGGTKPCERRAHGSSSCVTMCPCMPSSHTFAETDLCALSALKARCLLSKPSKRTAEAYEMAHEAESTVQAVRRRGRTQLERSVPSLRLQGLLSVIVLLPSWACAPVAGAP